MEFIRQTHCSGCGIDCDRPTYAMLTIDGKDVVVGLCPKCLAELVAVANPDTVATEPIDVDRVDKAKRV